MNRLMFDPEEDQWRFQPLVPAERSGPAPSPPLVSVASHSPFLPVNRCR